MADSISTFFKGKPQVAAPSPRVTTPQVPYASGTVSTPSISPTVTQGSASASATAAVTEKSFGSKMTDALLQGGVTMATGAIMNAMNKPKDAEKELIKEKYRAQTAAAEGAARLAKAKKVGGYGSTISPNSKVGGSSLAR